MIAVPVVGRGDDDRVDVFAVQDPAEVADTSRGVPPAADWARLEVGLVDVADRRDLDLRELLERLIRPVPMPPMPMKPRTIFSLGATRVGSGLAASWAGSVSPAASTGVAFSSRGGQRRCGQELATGPVVHGDPCQG